MIIIHTNWKIWTRKISNFTTKTWNWNENKTQKWRGHLQQRCSHNLSTCNYNRRRLLAAQQHQSTADYTRFRIRANFGNHKSDHPGRTHSVADTALYTLAGKSDRWWSSWRLDSKWAPSSENRRQWWPARSVRRLHSSWKCLRRA